MVWLGGDFCSKGLGMELRMPKPGSDHQLIPDSRNDRPKAIFSDPGAPKIPGQVNVNQVGGIDLVLFGM